MYAPRAKTWIWAILRGHCVYTKVYKTSIQVRIMRNYNMWISIAVLGLGIAALRFGFITLPGFILTSIVAMQFFTLQKIDELRKERKS